jgi:hypothetical protein
MLRSEFPLHYIAYPNLRQMGCTLFKCVRAKIGQEQYCRLDNFHPVFKYYINVTTLSNWSLIFHQKF